MTSITRILLSLLLSLAGLSVIAQPANDQICDAEVVDPDGNCASGTTVGATPDVDDPGCAGMQGASVWYAVTISPGNDTLHIDFSNVSIPGQQAVGINIYTIDPDCNGVPVQFPGGDFCGTGVQMASLTLDDVVPGTTYYIQVLTPLFETGEFDICFQEAGPLVCIATSTCEDPEPLSFPVPDLELCITGCLDLAGPGPSSPDSCFDMPNETVWYSITLPPIIPPSSLPAQATITVTTSGPDPFPPNPQLAVFQNCASLNQVACDYGEFAYATGGPGMPTILYASASVTFPVQDFAPEEFLIAVSYEGDKIPDDFELCISIGGLCNEDSEITVVSTSLGSPLDGPYAPGEDVEICLRINDWNSGDNTSNCNFLHGLVPQFGECWDPLSFDDEGQPVNVTVPMTNNTGFGQWEWFEDGLVTYSINANPGYLPPNTSVGGGWFYIRNEGDQAQCTDYNNPNCTRGDGFFCEDEINVSWEICFVLTTKPFPDCEIEENTVCDISFRTFGDGETGGYSQVGCVFDQEWTKELSLECCEQPFFDPIISQFNCSETEILIELESNLDPDVEYVWEVSPNSVGATPCSGGCPNFIQQTLNNETTSPVTVTYTVTPTTISDGCVGEPFPIDVEINPRLTVEIPPRPTVCAGSCVTIIAVADGGEFPYFYFWEELGAGSIKNVCPIESTEYTVTVTDARGCTATATQVVNTTPVLTVEIDLEPNTDNICENDPDFPIQLTAEVVEGGSGNYIWAWGTGEFTQTIDAPESDIYCITVIDGQTQCTGEVCQAITVNPAPEPEIEDPGLICDANAQFCLSAEPEGGEWMSDTIFINNSGCINPANAGPGVFEVCYMYTDPETMCDSTTCIEIEIIGAPIFDRPPDTIVCDRFILPPITGLNLSGSAAYFTEVDGMGIQYNPGAEITGSIRLYLYENINDGVCISQDSFDITIYPSPNADFTVLSPICIGDTSIIMYTGNASAFADFQWDFGTASFVNGAGPGPYQVVWDGVGTQTVRLTVDDQNCPSEENIETIVIEQVLSAPVVNCETSTTQIEFTWSDVPGAMGYGVNLISGMPGVQNGNTYLVTGLNPMDEVTIEVIALSDGVCGNSSTIITCNAIECPDVEVVIDPVSDICLTGNNPTIDLSVQISGGDGSGSGEWSGLFTSPTGIFDPESAGPGSYLIGYNFTEQSCNYSASLEINVNESPSALFDLVSEICVEDIAMAVYQGNAGLTATYTWDFDGGVITNGTGGIGPGPHEIEWNDGGTKIISLMVEENGCVSNIQFENIDVIPTLESPVITCTSTTEQIIFSWVDVAGSTGFNINLISGPAGVIDGNTYTVSNLDPEQSVTILVEALSSGPCPNSASIATECFTMACSLPEMTIDAPSSIICLDNNSPPIDLEIIYNPNDPSGSGVWLGNGIIDDIEGIFDPLTAGLGTHTIQFDYTELNCTESISTQIEIFEIPIIDFNINDTICIAETANLFFTGPNPNGNFNWSFDGANIINGSDSGPYELGWDSPGTKMVELILERNGCESELLSLPIYVEDTLSPLIIDCNENYEDVEFSWNNLANVTQFEVYINGMLVSIQSANSYTATGLNPGEMVEIEVIAINNGRCPNAIENSICFASNCPPIDLQITPGDTSLCLIPGILSIDLDSMVTGGPGSGSGSAVWSGMGVDPQTGLFDPTMAGIGLHSILLSYNELDCTAESSIEIEVLEQPVSSFIADQRICVEDAAIIEYTGTNPSTAIFDWDTDGGTIQQTGPTTFEISWSQPGTYNVSLVVEDGICRSQQNTQQVIVEPTLDLPILDCITTTESIQLNWDLVDCAVEYEVYADFGSGLVLISTQSNTDILLEDLDPEQEVDIQVVAISDCACPSASTLISCAASACPPVVLNIEEIGPFCFADLSQSFQLEVDINGGNGGSSNWSGPGVSDSGLFDPITAGVGSHTIYFNYSEMNCGFIDSMVIDIYDDPFAQIDFEAPSCAGESDAMISIDASGGNGDYSYFLNGNPVASPVIENLNSGIYQLQILDGNNCEYEEQIVIPDALNPELDIDGPFSIFIGNTGTLTLQTNIPQGNINSIVWETGGLEICDGCTTIDVMPDQSTEYCLSIIYNDFCEVSECIDLRVEIEKKYYVPTVFSPNEDGVNDYFTIYTNNAAQQMDHFRIFDRWGEMVFETQNIPTDVEEEGWDGKFGGEQLSPGVYVFVAELRYSPTVVELVTGDVTLVR